MATQKKVRKGEEFVFCNGAKASSLAECKAQLKKLTPEQFAQHVNEHKHDIYVWVRDCLDPKLAQTLKSVTDRNKLVALL